MGIFDRLSRLARAEANHLLDSAADAAGMSLVARAERGPDPRPACGA